MKRAGLKLRIKALAVSEREAKLLLRKNGNAFSRPFFTPYESDVLLVAHPEGLARISAYAVGLARLANCIPELDPLAPGFKASAWTWILDNVRCIKPFPVKSGAELYEVDIDPQQLIAC